ncbi:MAG TPA: ornithine decarboxylase, partial [Streptosporangiaceae bacterium]|nr:ornithine decarboxylase [Streptosporangiaceae bacterium]
DGWRRQMAQHGHGQLSAALPLAGQIRSAVEALPGLHVEKDEFLGAEASHDLDPLHVVIDVSGLGVSGYDAADWLREHQRIDMGLSDHLRVEATLSLGDDDETAGRLLSALAAGDSPRRQVDRAHLRRADHPYPPGIPVIIPGERITAELFSYLRSGVAAGMQLPDPADPSLHTIRVVAQD